jgi:hypothetical protein
MRRILPLAAAAALCLSCTVTPFNADLSRAARTVQRLTQDNADLITFSPSGMDGGGADSVFYPAAGVQGFDYGAGMVTWTDDLWAWIGFARPDDRGSFKIGSNGEQEIPNKDEHAPAFQAWPVKGACGVYYTTFDALYPAANNSYGVLGGDPGTGSTYSTARGLMSDLASSILGVTGAVVGASVTSSREPGYDMAWNLTRAASTGLYVELGGQVSSAGLANPMAPRGFAPYALDFLPAGVIRCMYYFDQNEAGDSSRYPARSFASWWDEGAAGWKCRAWWEDAPGVITSKDLMIDHRVDALLSTGELLSTEDGTGRLYDRDGALLCSFPMGNLACIGERFVDGEARTYFSQCLIYDDTLHFNVYRIATRDLATLGS